MNDRPRVPVLLCAFVFFALWVLTVVMVAVGCVGLVVRPLRAQAPS